MTAPTSAAVEQPVLTHAPRRFVLYRHRIVAQQDLKTVIPATFAELYHHIGQAGVAPAGPPFVIYHDTSAPGVRWEIDICAPIGQPVIAPPGLEYVEMPSCIVVSLLHVGPYKTLADAYDAVEAYIREHGLTLSGPPREFYFSEPDVPPSEVQTLIERPVC